MNISLFPSAFYPHVGGVEELVRQLAHEQQRRGDRTLIVTNRWPKDLPAAEEFEGMPVRRYNFRVPERTVKQRLGALLYGPSTLRRLCNALRAHHTEVIHVQCVSSNSYYALQAKRRLNLPLVVTLQGELTMDATGLFKRSAFARRLLHSVLCEADAITACSDTTLADAETFFGQPFGPRARTVYNGIGLCDFKQKRPYFHARPFILGIGRLVPQKGFDILIRAFAQSRVATHDLLIAGDGVERPALEQLTKQLGVDGRVLFLGRADRSAAVALFQACDLFVLPSRQEPFGIVNLEAMAAGKAVIASRVGGVPEIVQDGVTGLLVPGENIDALSEQIKRLAGDGDLCERLGAAGCARAKLLTWSAIASQYADVYADVCEPKSVSIKLSNMRGAP